MSKRDKLLRDDLNSIIVKHRLLEIRYQDQVPKEITGLLKIVDKAGFFHGSFEILVPIPERYPYSFPLLFESSNKIPKTIERHIQADGSCCVCILQKQHIAARKGISLISFIDDYVIPFLAAQLYYGKHGVWPNGEYEHGYKGVLQYYCENFGLSDKNIVLDWLSLFLKNQLPDRNDICICGRGKFKKCHLKSFQILELIGMERIREDLNELIKTE